MNTRIRAALVALTITVAAGITAATAGLRRRPMIVNVDPSHIVCPNCNAQVGEPCTQPTEHDRRTVSWFHFARINTARQEGRTHA